MKKKAELPKDHSQLEVYGARVHNLKKFVKFKSLTFSNTFNQNIKDFIPNSVTHLTFGWEFNQELNQDSNKKLKKSNNYKIIPSRELAIKTALQLASKGDVILLAGKGHETYLDIEGKKIPFDERDFLPSFRI